LTSASSKISDNNTEMGSTESKQLSQHSEYEQYLNQLGWIEPKISQRPTDSMILSIDDQLSPVDTDVYF
jgi:hypothetical protein